MADKDPVVRRNNTQNIDQELESNPIHERNLFSDVDRGWAFVVLCASFGSMFCAANLTYATGVLHVALLEKFRMDAAFTSLSGSVFISLLSLMGMYAFKFARIWEINFNSQ
jgi:hypothetical protein